MVQSIRNDCFLLSPDIGALLAAYPPASFHVGVKLCEHLLILSENHRWMFVSTLELCLAQSPCFLDISNGSWTAHGHHGTNLGSPRTAFGLQEWFTRAKAKYRSLDEDRLWKKQFASKILIMPQIWS